MLSKYLYIYSSIVICCFVEMVRRGLRGRAGSGKGVRTLVEHFNLFFSREYNVERNHVHLNLSNTGNESASGDEPTSTGASAVVETIEGFGATYGESVDWDSGRLELKPVVIPRPTCVIPHQQPRGFVRSNASSGWGAVHPGGFDQGILHDGMTHQANSVVSSYEDILFVCDLCAQFYTPTPVEGTIPSHGTVSKPSMTTEPVTVTSAVPGAPSPLGRSPMISARKVRPHTLIPTLGNLKFHHSPLDESYMDVLSYRQEVNTSVDTGASPELYYPTTYGEHSDANFAEHNPMHHNPRNRGGVSPMGSPSARSWSDARMRSATMSSTYSNPNNPSETLKKKDKPSIFAIVKLSARKLILVDNVLGLHLPLLQLVWDQVDFTMAEETTVSGIIPTDTDTASAYYPTVSSTPNGASINPHLPHLPL